MSDWLEEYGQRLKNRQSLILSGCSGVPVFPYIYKYNDIDKINSGETGTPAFESGVPGVPEGGEREHREHLGTQAVYTKYDNVINEITPGTPGTPGTPPGKRVQHARASDALPAPTLRVLARLQEYFTAKGHQVWEADTLALATLAELMRRKGGPVAFAEEVEADDELGKAIGLVKDVFGAEVAQKLA